MSASPVPTAVSPAAPIRSLVRRELRHWRYWAATAPFVAFFAVSSISSLLDLDGSRGQFRYLGYPEFLAAPLSILELLGLIAIVSARSRALTDLAFAGFLLELLLAGAGHAINGDPDLWLILAGLVVWAVAFAAERRRRPRPPGYVPAPVSAPVRRAYLISNGLLCAVFAGSVLLTIFDPVGTFEQTAGLGYPMYTAIPLAVLKALGIVAILSRRSRVLADFAYAGFLFDLLLALAAHVVRGELYGLLAASTLVVWVVAFATHQLRFPRTDRAVATDDSARPAQAIR